jgi:hypothetical protein
MTVTEQEKSWKDVTTRESPMSEVCMYLSSLGWSRVMSVDYASFVLHIPYARLERMSCAHYSIRGTCRGPDTTSVPWLLYAVDSAALRFVRVLLIEPKGSDKSDMMHFLILIQARPSARGIIHLQALALPCLIACLALYPPRRCPPR